MLFKQQSKDVAVLPLTLENTVYAHEQHEHTHEIHTWEHMI